MFDIRRRTSSTGPSYPTVSWRKKRFDSKIHYDRGNGRTVCGQRIPYRGVGEGDSVDMCERCLKIMGQ